MPVEIMELVIKARVCNSNNETASEANARSRNNRDRDENCSRNSAAERAARTAAEILNRKNER